MAQETRTLAIVLALAWRLLTAQDAQLAGQAPAHRRGDPRRALQYLWTRDAQLAGQAPARRGGGPRRVLEYLWTRDEVFNERYLEAIDQMAGTGAFDHVVLSERHPSTGVNLCNLSMMEPHVRRAVERARLYGLEIGVHTYFIEPAPEPVAEVDRIGIVRFATVTLDSEGRAETDVAPILSIVPELIRATEGTILGAWVYEPAGRGEYVPGTLSRADDG